DYSARSVIVVGPDLKLHQCGLPKKIALELYQPFIIRRLKELGYADTIKSAKKMLERKDEEVWDILEEVIREHPVMLNRAPTLHRMGIQAFQPILIEGNAIRIHPLVCAGFNADFDGDQMAVHLPLSLEAQVEANTLMLATNNIFSPAHGNPIITPSQDIVLGCYYLTADLKGAYGEDRKFHSPIEVFQSHAEGKVALHALVKVRVAAERRVLGENGEETSANNLYTTTPGRVIFNDVLPSGMPYYNYVLNKKRLNGVISDCYKLLGREKTLQLLDDLKDVGFRQATLAGLSFSTSDLKIPPRKNVIIQETQREVEKIEKAYADGVFTEGERYNQIIDRWTSANQLIGDELMRALRDDEREGRRYLNPIFLMADSGARGSAQQIRQLAGMRGLMAKPSGKIIETPIKANFREGLKVLEYFSSTHGARKGLADTALKTADSGYLTRKLADVAQNVVVNVHDCGTLNGITKTSVFKGDKVEVPLWQNIRGRVARDTITDVISDEVIVRENDLITDELAQRIEKYLGQQNKIRVRSPMTCDAGLGICALCYGMDLSRKQLVEQGLAVGIIAAQSIGEPGTQLTMRTFHIGGVASKAIEEKEIRARQEGVVKYRNLRVVTDEAGRDVVLNRNGEMAILDDKLREVEHYPIPAGARVLIKEGVRVKAKQPIVEWDPHMIPILSEKAGIVDFEDVVEGVTLRFEVDPKSKHKRKVIAEHKGDLHPQVIIKDEGEKILGVYAIPEKAHLEVERGVRIQAGTIIAKTPREITGTQDITGGLPRVTELFEVRKPNNPSVISEIDGTVELGEKVRGKRTIVIRGASGNERSHQIPQGKHLRVHRGDNVKAGEPLVDGPRIPQDILRVKGEEDLQQYLIQEVQGVYRAQNVGIDDKHIEVIVAQMLRKVQVEDPGDSDFLPGAVADKFRFRQENERLRGEGKKPATAKQMLLGITKASLYSDSFISAASFQETTKVLTEASINGFR
ncbi:MAG: DNA-directed RNA polymerase subunit beta', partial [Planctomycetes bacterium]|nr:DNA-directed RNA polymerase subunit beta' [Planctomycetota bacterium]